MADLINGKTTRDVLVAGRVLEVSVTSGRVGVHIIDTGLRETVTASKVYGPFNKDVHFTLNAFDAVASYLNATIQPSDTLNSIQAVNTNIKGVAGVGGGKLYDENGNEITIGSAKGIYLPKGWNDNFKSKLLNAGTQRVPLAFTGDSLSAGLNSSNLDTKSLAGLVRIALQAKYGNGGSGFKSSFDSTAGIGAADVAYTDSVAQSSLIALTGTWSVLVGAPDGPGANVLNSVTAGSTASYVINGDTAAVYVLESNSVSFGSYSITIDGVSKGTFTVGSKAARGIQVQQFTGLGQGNHTIVLTTLSTGDVPFIGFAGFNTTGIIVNKYGRGTYTSKAFNNVIGDSFKNSAGVTFGGANKGLYGPAGKWSGGSLNKADLIVYSTGLNDARVGLNAADVTTPDVYIAGIRDFLDDVKQNSDSDVMLLLQHQGALSWQEPTTKYYALYAERLRALAEHYGAAFVNLNTIGKNSYQFLKDNQYLGAQAPAGTYNPAELVHFSDAGFQWQFEIINPLITG